ncbi:DUF5320 domain-containing protein [uncultured Methanoregula sp.]|nr:DUF5320 domain-containing protein [uncultured Methanoregula sp.]
MPNFDGTGPLKRGRIIGRGLGPCKRCDTGCERRTLPEEPAAEEERQAD